MLVHRVHLQCTVSACQARCYNTNLGVGKHLQRVGDQILPPRYQHLTQYSQYRTQDGGMRTWKAVIWLRLSTQSSSLLPRSGSPACRANK